MVPAVENGVSLETHRRAAEIFRIASVAVRKAQEESRRMGVPNVYSINGFLYYELPSGELTRDDPWQGQDTNPNPQQSET